ncbi:MAG: YafY family protein [Bacteroidota bacterium]
MAKDKPRLARLTAILTDLQAKRLITSTELSDKYGVSVRTIYRDIRTLEQSGIPITVEEGKGYSLMQGYKLPPVMFTEEEANALITAEHMIRQNRDQSFTEQYSRAITKIKSVLRHNQQEKTELLSQRIQIRDNWDNEKTSNYLMQLQAAITNYQVMKLDYLSLQQEHSQREIEPFALYSTKENWILIAFCRKRDDFRAFRLDCMQKLFPTGTAFTPHPFSLQEYFEMCRKKYSPDP